MARRALAISLMWHSRWVAGELDYELLWKNGRRLGERVTSALERDAAIDSCLDIVVDLLDADRGVLLLEDEDGEARVVNARGKGGEVSPTERRDLSRTILAEAKLEPVLWDPMSPAPSASFQHLGITAALAAPLRVRANGATRVAGVLYADYRGIETQVGGLHLEFIAAAATLLSSLVIQDSHLRLALDDLRTTRSRPPTATQHHALDELLAGDSLRLLREDVASAATSDQPILILGESGTGKTMLAQALASTGQGPVVRAVLGGSDDLNTITSELFGHERGAFSGARGNRTGLVEYADGGTLILDEILNLPSHAQQLLLDFTQFGTFRPLGYSRPEPKKAQVRLIAATNGDIDAAVASGRFREDLYYRLARITLEVPALRERRSDIPELARAIVCSHDDSRDWRLSDSLAAQLRSPALTWPGNIRQLEGVILRGRDRALVRDSEAGVIDVADIRPRELGLRQADASGTSQVTSWGELSSRRAQLDELERSAIEKALAEAGGVVAHAAKALGVARTTLASRISRLGIQK